MPIGYKQSPLNTNRPSSDQYCKFCYFGLAYTFCNTSQGCLVYFAIMSLEKAGNLSLLPPTTTGKIVESETSNLGRQPFHEKQNCRKGNRKPLYYLSLK